MTNEAREWASLPRENVRGEEDRSPTDSFKHEKILNLAKSFKTIWGFFVWEKESRTFCSLYYLRLSFSTYNSKNTFLWPPQNTWHTALSCRYRTWLQRKEWDSVEWASQQKEETWIPFLSLPIADRRAGGSNNILGTWQTLRKHRWSKSGQCLHAVSWNSWQSWRDLADAVRVDLKITAEKSIGGATISQDPSAMSLNLPDPFVS